jgi:hypothetical protein
VLTAALGRDGISKGADIIINERTYGQVLNNHIDVPALIGDPTDIIRQIRPVPGAALTFTAPAADRKNGLSLIPYFRVAHERYSVYLKVSPKQM